MLFIVFVVFLLSQPADGRWLSGLNANKDFILENLPQHVEEVVREVGEHERRAPGELQVDQEIRLLWVQARAARVQRLAAAPSLRSAIRRVVGAHYLAAMLLRLFPYADVKLEELAVDIVLNELLVVH